MSEPGELAITAAKRIMVEHDRRRLEPLSELPRSTQNDIVHSWSCIIQTAIEAELQQLRADKEELQKLCGDAADLIEDILDHEDRPEASDVLGRLYAVSGLPKTMQSSTAKPTHP